MSEKAKESMARISNALDGLHPDDAEKVAEFAAAFTEGFAMCANVKNGEVEKPKEVT